MRVCIDTNVLVQIFGTARPYSRMTDALQQGRLEFAVSTEILFEYEETVTRLSGLARWQTVIRFFDGISRLIGILMGRFPVVTNQDQSSPGHL
jgi:hypothetical protein